MFRLIAIAVILAATPAGGYAAATDWVEIGPGSRMRLISDDTLSEAQTTRLGVEIELAPDTKTYWRVPGESGLPLLLDFADSTGIESVEVSWPFPLRERKDGFLDHVYYGAVTLPVAVKVEPGAASLNVHAQVIMGVCSDICIPAQAEFDLPVSFDRPDRSAGFRLDAAMAEVPVADSHTPPPFGKVATDEAGEYLYVETGAPIPVAATLIVDCCGPAWLFGAPQNGPHSGLLKVPVLVEGGGTALVGETVRLTYMTEKGPYELVREIGPFESVDSTQDVE